MFFCVGSEKSGTTLLARVLDQHPDVACIWESYAFRPNARASIFNPDSEKWGRHGFSEDDVQLWSRVWNDRARSFLGRIAGRLTGKNVFITSCFRRTMPSALDDFARRCDARVVGDKWPAYIRYIDELLTVFPDARIIYNVRDPRALWNSAQRFKERRRGDELLEQMLDNDRRIRPYLERPNFLTVRYEDLVLEPDTTVQRMYDFLGCDFSASYLQYDPGNDPYPERWSWIPASSDQIDPRHAIKWREEVDPADVQRITGVAAEFIDRHGYDRS